MLLSITCASSWTSCLWHGPGHESNGCPLPRTTDTKQCYHCQGLGHVQADCPTLRISGAAAGGRCYSCGNPGHLAVNSHFTVLMSAGRRLIGLQRNCPTSGTAGAPRGIPTPRGGFAGPGRGGFAGAARPAMWYVRSSLPPTIF